MTVTPFIRRLPGLSHPAPWLTAIMIMVAQPVYGLKRSVAAMMRHILSILMLSLLLTATTGCDRHNLPHPSVAPSSYATLHILFDWEGYTDIPPGMNMVFYPIVDNLTHEGDYAGSPIPYQLQFDGGKVSLPVGRYNVIFYNDYTRNINFNGLTDFNGATATVGDYNRAPLAGRAPAMESVDAPDILYSARLINLTVTASDEGKVITVRPILHTLKLLLHVNVDGIRNVSQADGSITGASRGVRLATGMAYGDECKRIFSFSVSSSGLDVSTTMFLSDSPLSSRYMVELAFLLRDNSVSFGKFTYDVTDQIVSLLKKSNGAIPPEGIRVLIDGVEVDEVSGGGFSAGIDGWGDSEDIELI
ncbi:MAG: DUF5119 domain-containing protein [Muribaculaceae bacterium]|nr:DUF5119 domain-containing protein [Muribaculaceae bacterium]